MDADAYRDDEVAALLVRCGQGDGIAFRRLYDTQAPHLYGVALRITRQPALASDAVHDAFLQVWRNAARYDPARGGPRAWLLSLARYRALDLVARIGREAGVGEAPDQADPDLGPLDRLLGTEAGTALHRCLAEMEPDRRGVLMSAFMDGLTHAEVSARTAMPLGTVKSVIRRGLLALRSCLDGVRP